MVALPGLRQILHISDVHFGPPHRPEVSAGVLALAGRRAPDLVVISGDLTQRARPEQFRQARDFVGAFEVPTLVVPGNHDVPMYRFWERLLDPYGAYRRHFAAELEPAFEDDEMLVVGVNTAFNWTVKDGRVTRSQLSRLERLLGKAGDGRAKSDRRAKSERRAKIVVAHHPLVPAPRYDTQRVLRGVHRLVEVLEPGGAELVLSGHLHQSWISSTEAYYPSDRRPVLLLHSGTSTSSRGRGCERGRNTCNWIRLDADEIEITHLGWNPGAGGFAVRSRHRYPRRGDDGAREAF